MKKFQNGQINPTYYSNSYWNISRAVKIRSGQPAFTRPKYGCLYVRILDILRDELLEEPTRKNIYKALQYGDWRLGKATTSNCVWAGLVSSQLIDKIRIGNKVIYVITQKGIDYLDFYDL